MLGCTRARSAGLDQVLTTWLDRGLLTPGKLSFNPLEALDPDLIGTRLARDLVVAGFSASTALDHYDGSLPSGFEEALRRSHWPALDWWLYELPQLANTAPPSRGAQMDWVPLQRVLLPGFLQDPASQAQMVNYLIAHGADPRKKLPFDPDKTVIAFAASIKSPMLALLNPPVAAPAPPPTTLAARQRRHRHALDRQASARQRVGTAGTPGGALRRQRAERRDDAALSARALSRWRSCRVRRARGRAGTPAGRGSASGTPSASAGWRRARRAAPRPRPESSSGCRRR